MREQASGLREALRDMSQDSYGGEGAKMRKLQVGGGGTGHSVDNYHICTVWMKAWNSSVDGANLILEVLISMTENNHEIIEGLLGATWKENWHCQLSLWKRKHKICLTTNFQAKCIKQLNHIRFALDDNHYCYCVGLSAGDACVVSRPTVCM